jgi:hypothetical protein
LARSADIELRGIASLELATDRSLSDTLSLGDQYWDMAGKFKQPQRRGLHLRAVHCYAAVAPTMPPSLEKVKLQRRVDEAAELYGREEIDRILSPLSGGKAKLTARRRNP